MHYKMHESILNTPDWSIRYNIQFYYLAFNCNFQKAVTIIAEHYSDQIYKVYLESNSDQPIYPR